MGWYLFSLAKDEKEINGSSLMHWQRLQKKQRMNHLFIYLFLIEEEGESMCMESVLAHLLNLLWCFRNKQHLPHLKKKKLKNCLQSQHFVTIS